MEVGLVDCSQWLCVVVGLVDCSQWLCVEVGLVDCSQWLCVVVGLVDCSQWLCESLADYSRVLMRLHSRMEKTAVTREEGEALSLPRDNALKEQFVRGVREQFVGQELRRIALNSARKSFLDMRDEALCLLREHDDGRRPTRVRGAEMSEYIRYRSPNHTSPTR